MGSIVRKKRNIYGSEFDSLRYLARFFDLTYRFRQPSRAALVAQLMEDMPIEPAKLNTPYGEEPQRTSQSLSTQCRWNREASNRSNKYSET